MSTQTAPATNDFDLDALLTESVEIRTATKNLAEGRKKLADRRTDSTEREAIQAKLREWEAASEWKPAAVAAMFLTQHCTHCSRCATLFQGIFQRQTHRTQKLERWVKEATPEHINLPREQKHTSENVAVCSVCADSQGFRLLAPAPTAFPVSNSRYL